MSDKPSPISRDAAIEKFGAHYIVVPQSDNSIAVFEALGKASHDHEKSFEAAADEYLTAKHAGERPIHFQVENIKLDEELSLPSETGIGQTVYVLRYNRGNGEWEQLTDEVTGVFSIDAISSNNAAPQNKGFSHSIIWDTESGVSFQSPLTDNPQTYDTQFVFRSAEAMGKFIETMPKSDNVTIRGLHETFNALGLAPAKDVAAPASPAAPTALTNG